nr:hypothetical protein [Tanacetum cinerariifolium]
MLNLEETSVPTEHVANEAVNEEMDDNLERATTTATSLEAEQARGNIRVNTPQSGEDSLKLTELMELCTNLQHRVFDLETTKTSEAQEIIFEKEESSADEESLGEEDASKQGRISNIDANQDIYLVNVHRDEDIFGVNDQDNTSVFDADKDLQGEEVVVEKAVVDKEVNVVEEVNAASITTPISAAATTTASATTLTISMDEITLANTLIEIKISMPKAKGIVVQEPSETPRSTPVASSQQLSKNIDGWKPTDLKNKSFAEIKELFDKAMARINNFVDFRTKLVEESTNKDKAETVQESDGEDLEVLWRLVKDRFVKTKPVDDMDSYLMHTLKTMFEHHVEDTVWKSQQGLTKVKSWKLFDSYGVHCVTMQNILYYLLVEKMYPLTYHTLDQMFNNVKLQVDYECEMAYELLRLVKK